MVELLQFIGPYRVLYLIKKEQSLHRIFDPSIFQDNPTYKEYGDPEVFQPDYIIFLIYLPLIS